MSRQKRKVQKDTCLLLFMCTVVVLTSAASSVGDTILEYINAILIRIIIILLLVR